MCVRIDEERKKILTEKDKGSLSSNRPSSVSKNNQWNYKNMMKDTANYLYKWMPNGKK
jgi:predicted nucleotide-binding protein (sugar kinase/HSP70/actin superfamily)